MELETINKLFLELSQFATAKTKREIELENSLNHDQRFVCRLALENEEGEKAEITRVHLQDFQNGEHVFTVAYTSGREAKVHIKVSDF